MEKHDLKIIKNIAYAQNGYIKVMKEQKNSKNTIIGLNCMYQRANKQHSQTSKNIKKVDQEGTIEFRKIVN